MQLGIRRCKAAMIGAIASTLQLDLSLVQVLARNKLVSRVAAACSRCRCSSASAMPDTKRPRWP